MLYTLLLNCVTGIMGMLYFKLLRNQDITIVFIRVAEGVCHTDFCVETDESMVTAFNQFEVLL